MCDRVRVWEKENEREGARDEERKIKTRWEEWVSVDRDTCVEEKKRKEKKKKCMDARKESKNNKKNKKSQLNVTVIFSQWILSNRLLLVNIGG